MFWKVLRQTSAARKASGIVIRLLALSSSVLSNHWTEAVCIGPLTTVIRCRAREQHLSLRIGFLLYAIALLPVNRILECITSIMIYVIIQWKLINLTQNCFTLVSMQCRHFDKFTGFKKDLFDKELISNMLMCRC